MARARYLLVALGLIACDEPAADAPTKQSASAPAVKKPARPRFIVRGTPGAPVAPWVKSEASSAVADGERVVVYVGASWCEPCQRFHEAVVRGELDKELAGVRFLEFDADSERDALAAAGYGSRMIPLFALPDPDGRGGARISGSIKGPGATADILPRLKRLLEGKPTS